MVLTALRLVDLGSPLSLTVLWLLLGSVFFVLVRKLRRDGGFGNESGL
jgi:hypothetical protein